MEAKRIQQIKIWLGSYGKQSMCPFHYAFSAGEICLEIFPGIEQHEGYEMMRNCGIRFQCPCNVYNVKKVTAIVEEVVKEHEKIFKITVEGSKTVVVDNIYAAMTMVGERLDKGISKILIEEVTDEDIKRGYTGKFASL